MRRENRQTLIFVALFVGLFGLLFVLFEQVALVRIHVVGPWTHAVAWVTAEVLQFFDPAITRTGIVIAGSGFGISIIDGCNGITPLALLVSGVLAFPTSWRARALGFAVGIPAVLLVNFVRVFALFAIGTHFPEWFDRTHLYVAQAFVILATGGIWLWWLGRFALARPEAEPAADG